MSLSGRLHGTILTGAQLMAKPWLGEGQLLEKMREQDDEDAEAEAAGDGSGGGGGGGGGGGVTGAASEAADGTSPPQGPAAHTYADDRGGTGKMRAPPSARARCTSFFD